ncbi:rRNA N6-adenosine-methyltransferase ZCCHC4-like [Mercenaria mercenaria]|uniref:rRNA N6-adenosine-methyltransferase ZCCHC4-like n=1 Tax=Mercenaria mercenaria TaxID=6596 RepID=UPI00234E8A17|nr:rRNA N6-adenosine-methyltransferase ZCCHC4-like [Mercenaria mercenaria]
MTNTTGEVTISVFQMAVNSGNVDVVVQHDIINIPECEHGPALMFSRFDKKYGSERRFFACSAFRDRKACPFFKWADEVKGSNKNRPVYHTGETGLWPSYSHAAMRKRFSEFKKLKESERYICTNCGLLLLPGERTSHEGQGHKLRSNISNEMLVKPTQLFTPLENNKTFAQYLFSTSTVDFILDTLSSLNVTHILCVGCPRIHEAVQIRCKDESSQQLQSLLLDLDHRFLQVFPQSQFCRYNMLNHHFFGGDTDRQTYNDFIAGNAGKKVAMVIDPPFGVMVDALNITINRIQEDSRDNRGCEDANEMPVFWFFPYFMEQRVVTPSSSYTMLDYKVDYDNHDLFRGEKGRKKGSPVRIFTNLSPKMIALPASEGYCYCKECEQYRALENKHCNKCSTCPTKDGNTYIHCDKCSRCVKPSRVHCETCNICDLPEHKCGQSVTKGCHICGAMDHKRRECPNKKSLTESSNPRPIKRKGSHQPLHKKKKKTK